MLTSLLLFNKQIFILDRFQCDFFFRIFVNVNGARFVSDRWDRKAGPVSKK